MPALSELGLRPAMNIDTGPDLGTGDFNRLDHADAVYVINTRVQQMHDILSTDEARPIVETRVAALVGVTERYRAYVQDETKYPKGAAGAILVNYPEAEVGQYERDQYALARVRLSRFSGKPTLIPDLDGTLTRSIDPATTFERTGLTERVDPNDYLLRFMPGSSIAEPILKIKGRAAFPEVFVKTWQKVLEGSPRMFRDAASRVQLRPGVNEFFASAKQDGANVTVLSANFLPFVQGVVNQIPDTDDVNVFAVTHDNLVATEKSLVIEDIAKADPSRPVIYLGDGSSDRNAVNPFVAFYFALEGSEFATDLTDRGVVHFTYRDFNDVNRTLQTLGVFSPALGRVA